MVFAKRLREGVVRGDITCSVRIWTAPHVTQGRRYRRGDGEIEIESVTPIGFPDITPELARESGFLGVLDLLKIAKHGKGSNIYLIRFHYIPPRRKGRGSNRKKGQLLLGSSTLFPALHSAKAKSVFHTPLVTSDLVPQF